MTTVGQAKGNVLLATANLFSQSGGESDALFKAWDRRRKAQQDIVEHKGKQGTEIGNAFASEYLGDIDSLATAFGTGVPANDFQKEVANTFGVSNFNELSLKERQNHFISFVDSTQRDAVKKLTDRLAAAGELDTPTGRNALSTLREKFLTARTRFSVTAEATEGGGNITATFPGGKVSNVLTRTYLPGGNGAKGRMVNIVRNPWGVPTETYSSSLIAYPQTGNKDDKIMLQGVVGAAGANATLDDDLEKLQNAVQTETSPKAIAGIKAEAKRLVIDGIEAEVVNSKAVENRFAIGDLVGQLKKYSKLASSRSLNTTDEGFMSLGHLISDQSAMSQGMSVSYDTKKNEVIRRLGQYPLLFSEQEKEEVGETLFATASETTKQQLTDLRQWYSALEKQDARAIAQIEMDFKTKELQGIVNQRQAVYQRREIERGLVMDTPEMEASSKHAEHVAKVATAGSYYGFLSRYVETTIHPALNFEFALQQNDLGPPSPKREAELDSAINDIVGNYLIPLNERYTSGNVDPETQQQVKATYFVLQSIKEAYPEKFKSITKLQNLGKKIGEMRSAALILVGGDEKVLEEEYKEFLKNKQALIGVFGSASSLSSSVRGGPRERGIFFSEGRDANAERLGSQLQQDLQRWSR